MNVMFNYGPAGKPVLDVGKMLFKRVSTPDGVGVLIGVETPANGLYWEPARMRLHVWFSRDEAGASKTWAQRTYSLDEVRPARRRCKIDISKERR